MIRCILAFLIPILCVACGAENSSRLETFKLRIKDHHYDEFVDHFYQFSSENRLNVSWFGWYETEQPGAWYENSGDSSFKIRAELLSEENGSIFAANSLQEGVILVSIDCGDRKQVWLAVVDSFMSGLRASNSFELLEVTRVDCSQHGS